MRHSRRSSQIHKLEFCEISPHESHWELKALHFPLTYIKMNTFFSEESILSPLFSCDIIIPRQITSNIPIKFQFSIEKLKENETFSCPPLGNTLLSAPYKFDFCQSLEQLEENNPVFFYKVLFKFYQLFSPQRPFPWSYIQPSESCKNEFCLFIAFSLHGTL